MAVFLILLGLIMGGLGAMVAGKKGRSKGLWFFACFLLGGLPLILLAFMPNLEKKAEEELLRTTKVCDQCAERVKLEANKCKHCGHEFAT
jgi:ribosomal protein L40E